MGSLLGPEGLWAFQQQQEQAGRGWAAQAEPKKPIAMELLLTPGWCPHTEELLHPVHGAA